MDKVIEILKRHDFEKKVKGASKLVKIYRSNEDDKEILEDVGGNYIEFLIVKDKLSKDEGTLIVKTCHKLLAKEVLKALNVHKIDEASDSDKLMADIAHVLAELMR